MPNPMNIESGQGILEIDLDRGVIYFHDLATGRTILRICKLKIPDSFDAEQGYDRHHTYGRSKLWPPSLNYALSFRLN